MGLKIFSLMKQVPVANEMRMGSDGLMDRTKAKSIINVDCTFGLEQGLQIKKSVPDAELYVVSMGPPSFEQSLKKAISMGYDHAILLSDKRLGGSDTFATGLALATMLKSKLISQDPNDKFIIFAGRQTSDGDTAHVPSQVAENLGIPQATFVEKVEYHGDHLRVVRMIEGGHQTIDIPIPCIISVAPTAIHARRPSLIGAIKARETKITVYGLDDIGLETTYIGLNGSPTVVANVVDIEHTRQKVVMIDGETPSEKVNNLSKIFTNAVQKAKGGDKEKTEVKSTKNTNEFPIVDFRKGASGVLTFVEMAGEQISRSSLEILNPARKLADDLGTKVISVLIGDNITPFADQVIGHGADEVVVVNDKRLKEYSILPFTSTIAQVIKEKNPEIALFAATTSGRELAPRLASRVKAGVTADCTALKIGTYVNRRLKSTFTPVLESIRPTYGESKLATIIGFWCPQMATARPGTFETLPFDKERKGVVTEFTPNLTDADFVTKIVNTERKEVGGQALFTADIIVSGGKPCGELDNFQGIRDLVDALKEQGVKAEWGASRQAVDRGYAPYARQVGQTGKTVRPKIYIAVGISGAIQHLSGIKDSGKIIAINIDRKANIFNAVDYGIIGDYVKVMPELIKMVKNGYTFGLKKSEEVK